MEILWKISDELYIFIGKDASVLPVQGQIFQFIVAWVSTCQQQEEHHFRKRLYATRCFLWSLTKFRNRVASEGNATDWVQTRPIIKHNRQSTHAKNCVIDLNLSNHLLSMQLPKVCQLYILHGLLCLRTGMISFSRSVLRQCDCEKYLRNTKFIL